MAKKVKTETKKTSEIISFDPNPRIHASFSRTVQVGDEWNKAEAGVDISLRSLDDAEDMYEKLWELTGNQVESIVGGSTDVEEPDVEEEDIEEDVEEDEDGEDDEEDDEEDHDEDDDEEDEDVEDEDDDEEDEDGEDDEDDEDDEDGDDDDGEDDEDDEDIEDPEEEEISEDDINEMSKPELIALCKNTEGLEEIDTSLKVKSLRKDIIAALFDDEEEGDWEDTDWEDD